MVARVESGSGAMSCNHAFTAGGDSTQQTQVMSIAEVPSTTSEVIFVGIASINQTLKIGRLEVDKASNSVIDSKVFQEDIQWLGAKLTDLHIVNKNLIKVLISKDLNLFVLSHDYTSM